MKNKLNGMLIFFLLLNFIPLIAQVLSGQIIYKQNIVENVFDSISKQKIDVKFKGELDFINESIRKNSNLFEFELKFNRQESLYKLIENMQIDGDRGYKIAANFARIYDVNYTNIQKGERLVQMESFGEKFVIKYNLNKTKWVLHNKSKFIKNYECFMATTTKVVKNSKGVFEKPVVAWYAPAVSLNFGPKGYGNLPGLILELQEDKLIYYATKINLNVNQSILITKPNKGRFLNEEEFEAERKKLLNSYWKGK
ncbi:MAG: GLPGLI family protein [Lutibacter sp.]|nr:GLPGLI family protein [Lutibacter sp.]